jgi:hypothetical protein
MYSRSMWGSFRFGDIQTVTITLEGQPKQKGKMLPGAYWKTSGRDVLIHNLWTGD